MSDAPTDSPPPCELAQKLGQASVHMRQDLEVSRHVFQQTPTYVVRDPVTFGSHRLDAGEYETMVRIDTHETLAGAFESLVHDGTLEAGDEEDFYFFVLYLHRSALLNLPLSDHEALFKRYQRRRRSKAIQTAMSPFFLKVPLWNPDAFLDRTHKYVSWLFTRWAVAGWLVLVLGAAAVAFRRRDELAAPLLTMLEFENLPLLWVVLIVLKVLHEFGHAYACKAFGGRVPNMGAFFIVGTPAAYVDASAAWGFPDVRKRVGVSLAGVYVETLCAAMAIFVWAASPPGLVSTLAYQVALMASVVTIMFNANPLARFDGYYVLSDLWGIPNLRRRASEQLTRIFDRVALGLRREPSGFGVTTRALLAVYGVGTAIYRIVIVISLSALIATKFFVIGLTLAAVFVTTTLYGMLTKAARHLWFAEDTAPVRGRAIAVSVLGIALLGTTLLAVPGRGWVRVTGVAALESERVVHAASPGFVAQKPPSPGQRLEPGAVLLRIDDPGAALARQQAAAELDLARARLANAGNDTRAAAVALAHLAHAERTDARAAERMEELAFRLRPGERLLAHEQAMPTGAYVAANAPLIRVGSGGWVVRALVDASTLAMARVEVGSEVRCRSSLDPRVELTGRVLEIGEAAGRTVRSAALAHTGGGPIAIDAASGESAEPLVELTVGLHTAPDVLHHGATVWVRLPATREPLATVIAREFRRFTNDLATH